MGCTWCFSEEEGIHGSVAISKKHGLDSVGISEYKNHTDSPFFTIYSKKKKDWYSKRISKKLADALLSGELDYLYDKHIKRMEG